MSEYEKLLRKDAFQWGYMIALLNRGIEFTHEELAAEADKHYADNEKKEQAS